MSKCRTCEYALYDGMCLAQSKFTLLDAPACDDYKPRIDVEVSKLKAENAKLRELVSWMYDRMDESCAVQHPYAPTPISYDRLMQALARARELGVEVSE